MNTDRQFNARRILRWFFSRPKFILLFIMIVLMILEALMYGFGKQFAPQIWTSKEDRICQDADYWYASAEPREFRLAMFNPAGHSQVCGVWHIFRY